MSFRVGRRDFVRFVGGGALGAATAGVSLRELSRFNEALASEVAQVPGGPETWALGLCTRCPAGCGLRVRKIGSRAVKVQGNPLHPVNHGGLCPKGLAELESLYHPDRLRSPMKNTGSRKSPRWKEISWEEAVSVLAEQLGKLRSAGRAHSLVFIDRNDQSASSRLMRRWLTAYGSPNHLVLPSGLDALRTAIYLQQGVTQQVAYDWDRARYVLSFGVDLLEGWGSPASIMRAFGRWRDQSSGRRTKFVQVEPRLSLTAAKADEWVTLRPGTEAALALGIAYVLITEGLYDTAFVRDHTFGFDDWRDDAGRTHQGFRSLVLSEYRLQAVAEMTGVPEETILRLAREFGNHRPSMALGDTQTSTLAGNPYSAMAVHSLNALVGSVDAAGGVLVQAESPAPEPAGKESSWPRVDRTAGHVYPGHHLANLPQAIAARKPYPVEAVILNEANPVFSMPNGQAFQESLRQVPFVASFTAFLDDSSILADLVLPAQTDLEKWQAVSAPLTFPHAVQSLAAPVVPPRHGARHPADVMLEVARKLGGALAEAVPFQGIEEYLKRLTAGLFAAQTGAVFSTNMEETWNRLLERSGWWSPTYSTADEMWEEMQKQGGWWDPSYSYGEWPRVLKTPSGRFEFYSQTLARWAVGQPQFARNAGMKPDDDRLFLPHQPPLAEPPAGYPLLLVPFEVLPLAGGEGAHLPYLQQIAGPHLFESWDSWLEIHPETAAKLHISDGETVWIESRRARAKVRARLYAGVRPGVVCLPIGYGHTAGSSWSRHGVNPLSLIEDRREPVSGLAQTASTYVKVYRG